MTQPADFAALFRDVVAAGTRHQRTLKSQTGADGFVFHCESSADLPTGVKSPYVTRPDNPGAFLALDPAGDPPPRPLPGEDGQITERDLTRYRIAHNAWEEHRQLYDDLFSARTPAEDLELVVAVGRIEYRSIDGEERHQRHLVAAPAEVELDQSSRRLTVLASDAFRVEHNWLAGEVRTPLVEALDDRSARPLLEVLADDAETHDAAVATWRRATAVYGQHAAWNPDGEPPVGVVGLALDPVVLLRKKDTSHLLTLLNDMVDDLAKGGYVSGPLRMLANLDADVEPLRPLTDRPALPRPANDEQRSMLDHARSAPHVVIQGPPGTGKTHTIANLVAVLLAEGRRVLVTAENDRALREVQGKLPPDMQHLLVPLLKEKANADLAASVSALVEAADQARRGARSERETVLAARRDELENDAADTNQQILSVDSLAKRDHELHGHRMHLTGHLIALDQHRESLAVADRYLGPTCADAQDAATLLKLHAAVTSSDRELIDLRLPVGLPDPAAFAQRLHETREQLAGLPDFGTFDYATITEDVKDVLNQALPRLSALPPTPYADISHSPGGYRAMARTAEIARPDLNHGVTVVDVGLEAARDWLAAYVDLPGYYQRDPASLEELHRRTQPAPDSESGANATLRLAASTDPVAAFEMCSELLARFTTDPTGGLLARCITDLRTRGKSRFVEAVAPHAHRLAQQTVVPATLPVTIGDGAPPESDLLEQAKQLRDHLAAGGKMAGMFGRAPRAVKAAQPLLEHVTVGGSQVDTQEETEAVISWLDHRLAVATARNWASQHHLSAPSFDAGLAEWLTDIGDLPNAARALNERIEDLLRLFHVPVEAHAHPPDTLLRDAHEACRQRIQSELAGYVACSKALGGGSVRVEGLAIHDRSSADNAFRHVQALITREAIASQLPQPWVTGRDLHDVADADPLTDACTIAAAAAELPGKARPQTLSAVTIHDVLGRVVTDRRRTEIVTAHRQYLGGVRSALAVCAPASPATRLLSDAVAAEDPAAYRDAHVAHLGEVKRAGRASKLRDATQRLQAVHPALVAAFLAYDPETQPVLADLGHYQELVEYRREAQELLAAYPDVRALHQHLSEVRAAQVKVEAELASERCWSQAVKRLVADRRLASALSSLQKANRSQLKTKTAKGYQRSLRAMRTATQEAAPAIPCWVMPIERIAELIGYPTGDDRFDVVIVDEASQAWFPSAFLYAIADQIVVVGDDLQTSPSDTSVTHNEMVRLVNQHIPGHRLVHSLNGEFSLYDIAASMTAPTIMIDHFRCVPPIIELSNALCYAQRHQRLLPVRVTDPDGLAPIRHVAVPDGHRPAKSSANVPEIEELVQHVVACHTDPSYDELTFGVIVVGPNPQAHTKLLRSKLLEALGPEQMAARQIEVGSPAQYQGAERHVVFLSLVDVPDENALVRRWPHEITGRNLRRIQALNVAVSRAQDQLWIFHSFTTANLKPDDARHVLLSPPALTDAHTLQAQLDRCDTNFERDVVTSLNAHPAVARVRSQVEALGYRIDIVVESRDGRRLAVECDGDPWHTDDGDVARDLFRQRTLETAGGWKFHRFLASEWYADPEGVRDEIIRALGASPRAGAYRPETRQTNTDNGKKPLTPASSPPEQVGDSSRAVIQPNKGRLSVGKGKTVNGRAATSVSRPRQEQTSSPLQARQRPRRLQPPEKRRTRSNGSTSTESPRHEQPTGHAAPDDAAPRNGSVEANSDPLEKSHFDPKECDVAPAPYEHWDTSTVMPDLDDIRSAERRAALRRIVEVEGPILGHRLYRLYVKSCGGTKLLASIRRELNRATFEMEKHGTLIADDPLGKGGQMPKTFRVPGQSAFVVRELGDRTLNEVPPLELAARIRALRRPGDTDNEVLQRVLESYGLSRLKPEYRKRLQQCAALLRG